MIRPDRASAVGLERFEHEYQVLGRLQHPGIAQIYEGGTVQTPLGPQPYFVMELVNGRPLVEFAQERRLDVRGRVALLIRICEAIQYAHEKRIIHRDLKPENILVEASGQPKILDFGIAQVLDPDDALAQSITEADCVPGTIPYMSPEQAAGRRASIDTRSDVYTLGLIAYELLSGRRAFDLDGRSRIEALHIMANARSTPLRQARPDLKGDLDTILGKALQNDKNQRYASAAELAADLGRYLAHLPILARSPSTIYQLRKFIRRNPALSAVLAAAMAGLLAFGTYHDHSLRSERDRAESLAAGLALERGTHRIESGQIDEGLLWTARGLVLDAKRGAGRRHTESLRQPRRLEPRVFVAPPSAAGGKACAARRI